MDLSQKPKKLKVNEVVTNVINEWDPMDLLALGGGQDEYSQEIKRITFSIYGCDGVEELAIKIKKVMDASFSTDLSAIVCLQVADLIWEEINKNRYL